MNLRAIMESIIPHIEETLSKLKISDSVDFEAGKNFITVKFREVLYHVYKNKVLVNHDNSGKTAKFKDLHKAISFFKTDQYEFFGTTMQIEKHAKLCLTKQNKYRRLKKATSKEEKYLKDLPLAIQKGEIPIASIPKFAEYYQDAYSRICMIRVFKRKEINGKVVGSEKNQWTGFKLARLVTYMAEENEQTPTAEFLDTLKQLRMHCSTTVDKDFCDGILEFQTLVSSAEKLKLQDKYTFNVAITLKDLAKALPPKYYPIFYKSLVDYPWLRCSKHTGILIYKILINELANMWKPKMDYKLKFLYFPKNIKSEYYRFSLEKTPKVAHTCETEAEANIVAKVYNDKIVKIDLIKPAEFNALDVVDSGGEIIPYKLTELDNEWTQAENLVNVDFEPED